MTETAAGKRLMASLNEAAKSPDVPDIGRSLPRRLVSTTIVAFANKCQRKICKCNFLLGRAAVNRLVSVRNSCDKTGNKHLYRLTNSLPYLLNRAGVRMGELFSRRIAGYDVTLPMYRVMAALWQQGDQRLGDLAAMTSLE